MSIPEQQMQSKHDQPEPEPTPVPREFLLEEYIGKVSVEIKTQFGYIKRDEKIHVIEKSAFDRAIADIKYFVDRCEKGEVRSHVTYSRFKNTLKELGIA